MRTAQSGRSLSQLRISIANLSCKYLVSFDGTYKQSYTPLLLFVLGLLFYSNIDDETIAFVRIQVPLLLVEDC